MAITSGIADRVVIDGAPLAAPVRWGITRIIRQAVFEAMNKTSTVTAPYDGDGLPLVSDSFSFEFPYDVDETFPDLAEVLETLCTSGGMHTIAIWKRRKYFYRLRAGQAVFWLPRGDAVAQAYVGFESKAAAEILIPSASVPAPVTVYQTVVTSGDTVPAGEVWISKTAEPHPENGKAMALCKLGTPPTAPADMTASFYPLIRFVVTAVPTQYPVAAKESTTLMGVETN
jgi:hypothetical protein